jgi:hypothetical protein
MGIRWEVPISKVSSVLVTIPSTHTGELSSLFWGNAIADALSMRGCLIITRYRLGNINIKMILRQCSILAVNFWSVTYFGVFNFGTSYLGAKIGQNKTMTNISRFM